MSTVEPPSTDAPALALDRRVVMAYARLAGGFWSGDSARRAWTITLALVACLSLSIGATLAMNHWNKWFFDALAAKDGATLVRAVMALGLIVATMAAVGVGIVRSRETLQVRWREWVTRRLIDRWLDRQRFYHLGLTKTEPANPEYRISDDTRWATEILVDCGIGLFLALIGAATFISILWSVGGSLPVTIGGSTFTIPAYMVLAALAYGITASTLMLRVGRPLIGSVVNKNEAEGHFRFALMRVRDNAESIALSRGAADEKQIAGRLYDTVVGRWLAIVRQHGNLTWITNASGPLMPIFPLLVATPKYLSGALSLGEVMQLAAAFVQVQVAISWIVDNYSRIADWYASARRIVELTDAAAAVEQRLTDAGRATHIEVVRGDATALHVADLTITDPHGAAIVSGVGFTVRPGGRLALSAPSGGGKTSLVRALAGLWPWGSGTITLPQGKTMLVVPQRPYVPATSLRHALHYPSGLTAVAPERYASALKRTGLGHLGSRLDQTVRWDHELSNGELQRLAIARVLVQKPDFVILDEGLNALDEASRAGLLEAIGEDLPDTAVITLTQIPPRDTAGTPHIELRTPRQPAPPLTERVAEPAE